MAARDTPQHAFLGTWRIVDTELWDVSDLDLVEAAHLTLKPTGQFREDRFVALDTDEQTVVHIPAAKARVLSAQPLSSYQLELVSGQVELRILDPKQFRMIKHLVIVTT